MDYVSLGASNLKVSRFCLGTMMFGGKTSAEESVRITRTALDAGINFVDTADVYASGKTEEIVGQALQGVRDQVVLASKAGMRVSPGPNGEGISRFHLVRALEDSLRRLKTDRIDIFYIHWPMQAMNLDETLRTLDDLVRAGKILYAACSNFPAWLVAHANGRAALQGFVPLICGQYPYNLIERGLEIEVLPMAQALNFGITIYRPLSIGVLTGKYVRPVAAAGQDDYIGQPTARGTDDERAAQWTRKYAEAIRKFLAWSAEHKLTPAAAATAWVASHPAVNSTIVGISRLEQLQENLAAFTARLSVEDRAALGGIFPTEVFEEAGGKFPEWRRRGDLLGR